MKHLPPRILQNIERAQYQGELLVAGVQLGILALLSALYIFAPAGYSPDAPLKAVPLGLSLFSIIVLLRLYFTVTKQLSALWIGASTICEMLLLIGTLWAYHIQFEQPTFVVLKNTAFLYIFILLALRALRFEPVWVILSGISAAGGWSLIVWNALTTTQRNIMTWDYVTYVTTERIHLGGEFDKILAILLVTAILALSLHRARSTLENSVTQSQAAADLSQFFDNDVARQIVESEASLMAGQGETRQAAILFTDMRGFTTAASNFPASETISLLGEYQQLVVPIIQKHGGNIDKFLGDGILASFGAVKPSNSYAADGFSAVDEILQAVDAWRARRKLAGLIAPDVGAGLAVGEVIFGVIGSGTRLEYTVIGDTVNLAAKLEKHNKLEETRALSSQNAFEKAQAQGYTGSKPESRMNRAVGGVTAPLNLVAWKQV